MPLIRSQMVYNDGGPQALEIVGSNGATFTLTKAQIQTFYQGTNGNAASRRAQVIQWIKDSIAAALGPQVDPLFLAYDFDIATGSITQSEIREGS